jgi:hypothetical protein
VGFAAQHGVYLAEGAGMRVSRSKAWCLGVGWIVVAAAGLASCSDDDYGCDDYGYCYGYYPYAYDYYYPSDMAYGDAYYSGYNTLYPGEVLALRLKGSAPGGFPGGVLRRLASGENVCLDQATVTSTELEVPCEVGSGASLPFSASVAIDACTLPSGGELSGSVEIDIERTLSDASCGPGTSIDVSFTSTTTDLSYTAVGGSRVVVPTLTRTGAFTRVLGEAPSALSVSSDGSIEHYDDAGGIVGSHTVQGMQTLTFLPGNTGYTLDGVLTLADPISGQSATLTGTGVTRTEACCHPTGGVLSVDRSEGEDSTWSFGPACGQVSRNGTAVTLKACY